jgi:hypothetical protein
MNDWETTRAAICYNCPSLKRGKTRIETWCSKFDLQSDDASCYANWKNRIADPVAKCDIWDKTVIMDHSHPLLDQYKQMLATDYTAPANLSGDGVIMALWENGDRAHLGVILGIRMLRELGWDGIIQLWHVGDYPAGLDKYNVTLKDFREVAAQTGDTWKSYIQWSAKAFAIKYSGLAKVAWQDWDAYFVENPRPLFDLLDEHPFLFWAGGDPWQWRYSWYLHNNIYGLAQGQDCPVMPIQGGLYLIDCKRSWKLIELQRFQDANSKLFYPMSHLTDEEGWRLSISALKYDAIQPGILPWRGPAWWNYLNDKTMFIHRCGGKLWADCCPDWNFILPREQRVKELHTEIAKEYNFGAVSGKLCNQPKPSAQAHMINHPVPEMTRLELARATRGRGRVEPVVEKPVVEKPVVEKPKPKAVVVKKKCGACGGHIPKLNPEFLRHK